MWDNCYFPMFLLRDQSLTLIYMASLMVHSDVVRLPTHSGKVYPGIMTYCAGMVIREVCYAFPPKVLADYPMYSSLHSNLSNPYLYVIPNFYVMLSLSFGASRRLLMVLSPLKWTCIPILPQMFLKLSLKPFVCGTTIWMFLWLLLLLLLLPVLLWALVVLYLRLLLILSL